MIFETTYFKQFVDRSKHSSKIDEINQKIGDRKHRFRRKDMGGSLKLEKQPSKMLETLLKFIANQGSLLTNHKYKIRLG